MDEHTIALLREVGDSGREATGADVAAAMRAGRRIRRRRRALQVVGSGGVLGVAVALLAVAGANGGVHHDTVVAADPGPAPASDTKPKPGVAQAEAKPAVPHQEGNTELLAEALGPDFRLASEEPGQGDVNLTPGTPSADRLGSGYDAGARISVFNSETDGFSVESACKPSAEKGIHSAACRAVKLDNGRVVQAQDQRTVVGDWKPAGNRATPGVWDAEMLYFPRADGTFVRVEFFAFETTKRPAAAQQGVTDSWLTSYVPTLAKVAADPRINPAAAAADSNVRITDHDRDQAILQKVLGGSFTLLNGKVQLEPGSEKWAELPSEAYGATAELSAISSAAFHAACDAKAGLAACETKTLDDGTVVHLRSWADRDAASSTMRGESAVYLERKDGSVLLANLEVTGRNVTAAKAAEHAKVVRQWLDSLQSALIAAITDPDVIGTPAAS